MTPREIARRIAARRIRTFLRQLEEPKPVARNDRACSGDWPVGERERVLWQRAASVRERRAKVAVAAKVKQLTLFGEVA